jgi:hypothetical protein
VAFFLSGSLRKLQNVIAVTDAIASTGMMSGRGTYMKKIFGLQRHALGMGDRHENGVDVLGSCLCAVRRPGSNIR